VIGRLPPGPRDAITDVPAVRVGHATVWHDEPFVARTGVTAVVPDDLAVLFEHPPAAGVAVLNGAGELTGSIQIGEWGALQTPILLTNTMGTGAAYQGAVDAMLAASERVGVDDVVIPVVGECDDSWLHDARHAAITPDVARRAIDAAVEAPPASGAIGAGTGMVCFGCKGGIGTASRVTRSGTVGALLLANFGALARLTVAGTIVGPHLEAAGAGHAGGHEPKGSCIVVLATDAPLSGAQCKRVARRAGLGLARTGSVGHHGSGEIFVAFSTTRRGEGGARGVRVQVTEQSDGALDELFEAAIDATEAAVVDALFAADTVVGRDGHTAPALPVDSVLPLLREVRR
jgi:D-aminopeptidase